ncbi:hypothetical protein [Pseudobutyrivibrio xylanivorans]|uniref:Uncharacterized protein n=1 Tax=Pseudobutyrivibrio xylanivorans TaxID=185007 RepID=A0A5P6VUL4_PSEXY|nr:hypothetical protein [Pseudobutyrivibrio xylanivorans]QFJ56343.1 hypothetical protein FXF36_15625 [Pseudobutyrivibrio xylanivorans]
MKSLKKVFAFALATVVLTGSVYYVTPAMKALAEKRYTAVTEDGKVSFEEADNGAWVIDESADASKVTETDELKVYDGKVYKLESSKETSDYQNKKSSGSSSSSSSSAATTDTSVPVGTIAKDVPVTINGQTVAVTIVKSVDQTNTLLAGTKDAIPAGSSLSTVEAAEGTQTYNTAKSILAIYRPKAQIAKVFNFNVFSKDAKPVKQANGKVAISIPIPEGLSVPAGMVLKVYKFNDDGTVTVCDCIIDNGRVVCGTDSFGTFAFVYEKASK